MTKKLESKELKIKRYTKEEFVEELTKLISSGEPVIQSKAGSAMIYSARKYFGSWKKAMEHCEIDYDNYVDSKRRKWSKEKVISEIKRINSEDGSLNSSDVSENNKSLMMASVRYFGSWKSAIEESGYRYSDYHNKTYWNSELISNKITELYNSGEPLHFSYIHENHKDIYYSAYKQYGSWKKAVESVGLEYNSSEYEESLMRKGLDFEILVGEIFTAISLYYSKYDGCGTKFKPDFSLPDLHWIDAKLSQFTAFKDKTIEKYEPYCNKLTIIFLVGDNNVDNQITNKTRMVNIYKFLDNYSFESKELYMCKLQEIEREVNMYGKKETK